MSALALVSCAVGGVPAASTGDFVCGFVCRQEAKPKSAGSWTVKSVQVVLLSGVKSLDCCVSVVFLSLFTSIAGKQRGCNCYHLQATYFLGGCMKTYENHLGSAFFLLLSFGSRRTGALLRPLPPVVPPKRAHGPQQAPPGELHHIALEDQEASGLRRSENHVAQIGKEECVLFGSAIYP